MKSYTLTVQAVQWTGDIMAVDELLRGTGFYSYYNSTTRKLTICVREDRYEIPWGDWVIRFGDTIARWSHVDAEHLVEVTQ